MASPSRSRVFIESAVFPASEVSQASAIEKSGGGRPEFWEMVFWWTRKPLISARAIIAGALLPEETPVGQFKNVIKLNAKIPHRQPPSIPQEWYEKYFKGKTLLDPFAGFGNIPLEAVRLGLENVVASELLPAAYIFLKLVLEYPAKFGQPLVSDVQRWGRWVTENLAANKTYQDFYKDDVAVYVGTWRIKCPNCGKWTPLVGNWWLARSRNKKGYERIAWMTPKVEGESCNVHIVDLNKILEKESFEKTTLLKMEPKSGLVLLRLKRDQIERITSIIGRDAINRKASGDYLDVEFKVPRPNIQPQKDTADCLHCGNPMHLVDPQNGRHYSDSKGLTTEKKKTLLGYVKYALKRFGQGDHSMARLVYIAKVKKNVHGKSEFLSVALEDETRLDRADEELKVALQENDPDIPLETIAPYATRFLHPLNYHAITWRDLFNPIQLLLITRITKLIREASNLVESEKVAVGYSHEDAAKYAEAVTAALAVSMCKFVANYSMATGWHSTFMIVRDTLAFRGISMQWNWSELNPLAQTTGSWVRSLSSMVAGLQYLVSATHSNNNLSRFDYPDKTAERSLDFPSSTLRVLLADASILNLGRKFDVIVTDPPYYHDVPYGEISDFYYVWLKRALSEVRNGRLHPRYLPEVFFKKIGARWVEIGTQWKEYGDREVSIKLASKAMMEEGRIRFLDLLGLSFQNCKSHLVDNGVFVTYYAHTDPDAWEALLDAGWHRSGFRVSNAFPITTESTERGIARGKLSLDTSIVVVWRRGTSGTANVSDLYNQAVKLAEERAAELIKGGHLGSDLLVGNLGAVLSVFTKFETLYGPGGELKLSELLSRHAYPITATAIASAISREAGAAGEVRSPEALFYLLAKVLFGKLATKGRKNFDRSNLRILNIATRSEPNDLVAKGIVSPSKGSAKSEGFALAEPILPGRRDLEEFLRERGISILNSELRNSVDALHVLEYWGVALPAREFGDNYNELASRHASHLNEGQLLAMILSKVLPDTDIEKDLCKQILEKTRGTSLEKYVWS